MKIYKSYVLYSHFYRKTRILRHIKILYIDKGDGVKPTRLGE